MTRKRFVKLLMSRGYSRNEANQAALTAISDGHTYDGVYFAVRVNDGDPEVLEAVKAVCDRIAEAVADFQNAINAITQKIVETIPTICVIVKNLVEQQEAAQE